MSLAPAHLRSEGDWRHICPPPLQVLTSVPDCPGHMTVLEQPLLVCGGDAFCHSNFDGCVDSALSVLSVLKASLANS